MADTTSKGFVMEAVDDLPKSRRQGGINTEFVELADAALKENPGKWILLGRFLPATAQQRKAKFMEKTTLEEGDIDVATRGTDVLDPDSGKKLVGVFAIYKKVAATKAKGNKGEKQPA